MAGENDETDHYKVLGLLSGDEGAQLTLDQIEKAYKTQSRLRHPDKRPNDPNATADFQKLRASYDFLKDDQSRRSLDAKFRARKEKATRDLRRNGKRRQMASDLEERERAAERGEPVDAVEIKKRKEEGVAREVERELGEFFTSGARRETPAPRQAAAGAEPSSSPEDKSAKEKVLKVSWDRGMGDYYSPIKLRGIFEKFGKVEDVVIRSKKSKTRCNTALIVMASRDSVMEATRSMCGDASNPLLVLPLQNNSSFGGFSPPFAEPNEPKISKLVGAGFSDFEASIMKKLQQANKNKQPMQ